ncbi:G2/mitotic-specific cyclin-B [Contarinia nasturtii]|uniref:G2/mitotic-specific cyclin-B n=1 Tax=Contarinia nasturtii TaxID=265458 RepID=UPI0012D450D9|nr:G2/mitotic-specific cyclin-B [Contarinia nasturtii]
MATRRAAAIVDENLITHGDALSVGVKKTTLHTATTTTTTRRAALGNLVNRTEKSRILNDKKLISQNSAENIPNTIDLKNVKARVDTHWKNEPLRKPLLRNNSVSKTSITSIGSNGSGQSGPKLVRVKSTETATLKEVKIEKPVMKRQDSTLTRRAKLATILPKTANSSEILKKKVPTNKPEPEAEAPKLIADNPVIQSRFCPPSFSSSYSNGLINGFDGLNIDDGDERNCLLVCEYVNDIYAYLFEMEQKYAIRKNHLDGQTEVHPRMRTVLLDWISEVHTQYHFTQETFHITVSLIDRYLQTVKTTSRKNLQLVGVAALFVASKYEELYPPDVNDFVYITDNTYTKEQILQMEKHILKKLKFEMGAPTAIHFLRRFSKAAKADSQIHILSKYFIELGAIDYGLSEYLPSEIAAASLYVSLCIMESLMCPDKSIKFDTLWNSVLEFYSTYSAEYLRPIVKDLITYVLNAPTSKTNNVYIKYKSVKQGEMALICERSHNILRKIINQE